MEKEIHVLFNLALQHGKFQDWSTILIKTSHKRYKNINNYENHCLFFYGKSFFGCAMETMWVEENQRAYGQESFGKYHFTHQSLSHSLRSKGRKLLERLMAILLLFNL